MDLKKVSVSIEDGTMDCVGGVRTEYSIYPFDAQTKFHFKGTTDDANVVLILTGQDLWNLNRLLLKGV